MMQRVLLAMVGGLLLWAAPARLQAADLATARTLYAAASYEEALAAIDGMYPVCPRVAAPYIQAELAA